MTTLPPLPESVLVESLTRRLGEQEADLVYWKAAYDFQTDQLTAAYDECGRLREKLRAAGLEV